MTTIPVTLIAVAAAALLNGWLSARIGKLRGTYKVSVGDGGHEPLLRRMRAQANFVENASFFLLLLLGIELSGGNRIALAVALIVLIVARIAHAIGIEGGEQQRWRMVGMMGTTFVTLALIVWALGCAVAPALGR